MATTNEPGLLTPELQSEIVSRSKERARTGKWDLNIAIFLFAVLILVIILVTYTKTGPEVVAPVAAIGLAAVWFAGSRREKILYKVFYRDEVIRIERELKKASMDPVTQKIQETIEEQIQKALRDRWK